MKKKIIKFSKSYKNIFNLKKDFINLNNFELKRVLKINNIHNKSKKRVKCKNCEIKLDKKKLFKSFDVDYKLCKICGHLNSNFQENEKLHKLLYKKKSNLSFGNVYKNRYLERVNKIYIPKVNFLKEVIDKPLKILDYGCGAGHFVYALELKKIKSYGFEINDNVQKLVPKKIKKKIFYSGDLIDTINLNKINCLSLINVLEHLDNPNKILKDFKKSNAKYLYISVPLFSFSVLIEHIFQGVFPKQLGGAHTHLYTEQSLNYIFKKFKLKILGEWWFGTDIADLMRSFIVQNKFYDKVSFNNLLNKFFNKHLDQMQNILDSKKNSQEVHIILKK
jgi:2-polyprenyl-3-methyl-5-hydroxy-6-metoxy-1,4-benzoquinol methylase